MIQEKCIKTNYYIVGVKKRIGLPKEVYISSELKHIIVKKKNEGTVETPTFNSKAPNS